MNTNTKLVYQRVLLKLSGEALKGSEVFGLDAKILERIAMELKELVALGAQIGIVIGGGNFFRGSGLSKAGINRVIADHMGMLATVMNGLAMLDALNRVYVNTSLMSSIPLNGLCDSYSWSKAMRLLYNNRVVIFSSGTGNPFFTTDSAACLRGIEIEADIVLKATKVDGVYSSDPKNDPGAVLYEKLSYSDVLKKELTVMDLAAFMLARDYSLPICVFNINKLGALRRVLMGEKEGTLIMH
ncbi:UMP kinase [Candidatus Erwinia haradaeae]|uniref:Uridylate kinase n=1 Tax=Candidatus Erwinia haradaeae TaxID=1922217 RepID=A0A451D7N1_9GAMM|nr:UMP kinase [Candidatus Erwinia haradaeae]VFP81859.1 Uridylate kinase [Candidatus Erwinia haradaeae]